MPLTLDQKRRLIQSHGLNPDEYDVDASEENIVPLPPKSLQPSGDVTTTVNLPKAPTTAPSMLDTARRGATQSLLPTAAGLAATAGTLALLPEPFISKIGAAGAGLAAILAGTGASIGASKLQDKIIPEQTQKDLFLRPEDIEQNKYTSILSGLAPSLLAFKPNLSDVGELIGGVQALPKVATAGSSALTQNQLNALINAGANVLPSAGMYGYDVATGQRKFDIGSAIAETLPGALLTRPTRVGEALGFHGPTEVPSKPKTITEKTAVPDISTLPPEELLRGIVKQFGIVPDPTEVVPKGKTPKTGVEVPFKSAKESAGVFEQQGYNPELLTASEAETQKIAKAREEESIRAKKLREAAFTQAEAEAEIQIQRAEATRLEAERLKKENEQRKIDIAIGGRKGFGEEAPLAERLKSSLEDNRLKGPTTEEIVAKYGENPPDYVVEGLQRDFDRAVEKAKTDEEIRKVEGLKRTIEAVKKLKESYPTPEIIKGEARTTKIPATSKEVTLDTRYKAEKPTTGFMQPLEPKPEIKFNNKLNEGKGYYQSEADLPPLDSTPIESLPSTTKTKIKNEIFRVARLRKQRVKYVDSLKNPKTGKEVLGQFNPDTNEISLNKQLFIGTTGPHETAHGRVIDFLNSGDKRDNDIVLRGLEFADERNRKFKSPEDFKKLPIDEQLAIEERFVSTLGQEGYRRIRTDLFGKRRERFGEWVSQVKNHFKTKFNIASPEELRGHFIERQMYDAHDNERVGGGVKIEGTGGKDIEGEKRNQEEKDLPEWVVDGLKEQGKSPKRMFNDVDLENPSVRNAINNDPTLTKEQKEKILKTGDYRFQESPDLPEKDSNISDTPASIPRRIFSSTTQSVRNLGGETADHVASQSEKFFDKKSLYEGKYSNTIQAEITSYPKEVRDRVDQYGREMMAEGKSDIELSPHEQSLYDSIREYLINVADDNTARLIKKDPNYWPAILNTEVVSKWAKAPNSPEGRYYQNEWMKHAQEQVDKGKANYTREELKKILDDYMSALKSGGREHSLTFGALRKAQGLGLPISMQDNNLLSRFGRYGNRVAKDIAFRETIESDPTMRYMFRIKDDKGQTLTEPPNLPSGEVADSNIRDAEPLQNVQKFMYEEFSNNQHPRIQAISRVINSALLGTATGVRDLVTSPLNLLPVIGARNAKALVEGLKDLTTSARESFEYGARKIKMNELEFGSAAHPDTLTGWFTEVADGLRKYSGREALEQGSRIYIYGVGKVAALAEFGRAANGNETSIKWLKKYGHTVDNIGDYIGKTGADIPEDVINRIAKTVTDRAAGTYDARGLPTYVMEGPLSPFFSLSRWGIEKANTIVEDVLIPARKGDYTPLISYTLGSLLTGAAIQQLNLAMSSGKKGNEPTLTEAQAANEQQVRAFVNLLQLGSYGGLIGDLMKSSVEAYSGHLPRGLSFPLADFVSETLGKNLADYTGAIQAGENKVEASMGLIEKILTDSIQSVKLLSYATWNKDDVERKNSYRDYRLWQELSGRKSPESVIQRPNEFLNKNEKEFKRAKTPEDIEATLPKAIESVITKAGGNPLELIDGFKRLKANSYQTWPTEPVEQVAYYEYLKQTVGEEKAAQSFMDFMQQRQLNKIKNRMIPNLTGKAGD